LFRLVLSYLHFDRPPDLKSLNLIHLRLCLPSMSTSTPDPTIQQLGTLRQQYYSLYPIFKLSLPPAKTLLENQSYLLSKILDDPYLFQYAPEAGYQKFFWRKVVAQLEDGLRDVTDTDPGSVCTNLHIFQYSGTELMDRRWR
jgi:hypothetical protein